MRPKAEWAIDSEPIRARGIIVNNSLGSLLTATRVDLDQYTRICSRSFRIYSQVSSISLQLCSNPGK